MRRVLYLMLIFTSLSAMAQNRDEVGAIQRLTGCVNIEEMDAYEVELLSDLIRSPLKINKSSVSELEKTGIFTPFQIASIRDYRSRHGDILSITELGMIDGFRPESVEVFAPFISLDSSLRAGERMKESSDARNDLYLRCGFRHGEQYEGMYGFKYRIETGRLGLSLSYSAPYQGLESYSGNLSLKHKLGEVILGDFNARFGQGLCVWNSTVIGGYTSPSAFMRKPSGVSPSFSFTGNTALTGVATELNAGRWKTSVFLAAPGLKGITLRPDKVILMPAANLSYYGKYGLVSITHVAEITDFMKNVRLFRIPRMITSADASVCINGVNIFAETAYEWVGNELASVFGSEFSLGEDFRMAAILEYSPAVSFSNKYTAALSGEFRLGRWIKVAGVEGFGSNVRRSIGNFSLEASYHPESKSRDSSRSMQFKAQADWEYMITEYLKVMFKVTERLRTWGQKNRSGIRFDAKYYSDCFNSTIRVDWVRCVGSGFLGYVEGGYNKEKLALYVRAGAFKVDDWDDRIYVYERDAPGTFNVPAYYGRGYWTALTGKWKYAKWGSLYLRLSYIGYDFMEEAKRKPGRAELKIQSIIKF